MPGHANTVSVTTAPPKQGAELQPGDREHGNGGVAEGVLGHHAPLAQPLARAVRT